MESRWARAGAASALAVSAVVAVSSVGLPGEAQTDSTIAISNPAATDVAPTVSDDGRIIAFVSTPTGGEGASRVVVHDRGIGATADAPAVAPTTQPVEDSDGAAFVGLSGDGCVAVWTVPSVVDAAAPDDEPGDQTPPDDADAAEGDGPVTSPVDPAGPDDEAEQEPVTTDDVSPDGVESPDQADPPDQQVADDAVVNGSVSDDAAAQDVESGEAGVDGVETAAFVGPGAAVRQVDSPTRLVAFDRCADGAEPVDLPLSAADDDLGPPAVSSDGSVVAVGNGTDVMRFRRRSDGSFADPVRFDGRDSPATDHLVSDRLDVSADGGVVVFSAGLDPDRVDGMTVFAHVTADGESTTTPILPAATAPTVSADGEVVAASTGSTASVVGRGDGVFRPVSLGPGRRPRISGDGNHVVIESPQATVSVISRTGQGDAPFASRDTTRLASTVSPTRSGPVIDFLGTTVVNDRTGDADTDIAVTALSADAGFDAEVFDLGSGEDGDTVQGTVTFSNAGPASLGVESLAADGPFAIVDDRCGAVVRPGSTCEIDVSVSVDAGTGAATATLTLTPSNRGAEPFTTVLSAVESVPEVATPTAPTTSQPSSTGGATTGGSSTGGSSNRGSSTGGTRRNSSSRSSTGGSFPRSSSSGGSRSSTGGSRSSSTGSSTRTTATTVAPGGVSASPASFDFAPTIVEAGRRTGLVEIVNTGSSSVTVTGVRIEASDTNSFEIVDEDCSATPIAAGGRCSVNVAFAPDQTGDQSASLVASLSSGGDATAALTGTGAPSPVLTVIPGVANVGQVVTVQGSGFPTGVTVELLWGTASRDVDVPESGVFNVPVLVMPNTRQGPADLVVVGQTDLFGDVEADVLVDEIGSRSGPTVLEGMGPSIGR